MSAPIALPEPPGVDATDAEVDTYLRAVDALTTKTVALVLPLESARQALLACRQIDENLALTPGDTRVAPLREAITTLQLAVQERVSPAGQESFIDALVDSLDATDAQRIKWLRICLAAFRGGRS